MQPKKTVNEDGYFLLSTGDEQNAPLLRGYSCEKESRAEILKALLRYWEKGVSQFQVDGFHTSEDPQWISLQLWLASQPLRQLGLEIQIVEPLGRLLLEATAE